jgi:hypothetical protein
MRDFQETPTMAERSSPVRRAAPGFRRRYDNLEVRRAELIARLDKIAQCAEVAVPCSRARTLLGGTYRKTTLARRADVLRAAAWLIDMAETLAAPG